MKQLLEASFQKLQKLVQQAQFFSLLYSGLSQKDNLVNNSFQVAKYFHTYWAPFFSNENEICDSRIYLPHLQDGVANSENAYSWKLVII